MIRMHALSAMMAMGMLSMGLLGQSEGCNVNAVIRIIAPDDDHFDDHGGMNGDDSPEMMDDHRGMDDGLAADEIRFEARLLGSGPESGRAKFRARGARRRLKVELEDAPVGSSHAILVDGIDIGLLTIGTLGEGEVEFDTNIEPGHVPWPAKLPLDLPAGTTVQVGPVSGTLGV